MEDKKGVEGGLEVSYNGGKTTENCKRFSLSAPSTQGWCAVEDKTGYYVQIDAKHQVLFTKIQTEGVGRSYVKSYDLHYSNDGQHWNNQGAYKTNMNSYAIKENKLDPPLKAVMLRIIITAYHAKPTMRFETYYKEYHIYIYIYK